MRRRTRQRLIVSGVAALVAAVALVFVVLPLVRDRDTSNLGDETFEVGRAGRIAAEIHERGPVLYPDLVGTSRAIWVQHIGAAEDVGWIVLAARDPETGCVVDWDPQAESFVDCDGVDHGPDGGDLFRYPVEVDGDVVTVDLNFEQRE